MAYVLNHSRAKVLFLEDQEQLDKLLEIETALPRLEHVVIFDARGTRGYDDPRLLIFLKFQNLKYFAITPGSHRCAWALTSRST